MHSNKIFVAESSILILVGLAFGYFILPLRLLAASFNVVFVYFLWTIYQRFTFWSRQGIPSVSFIPGLTDVSEYIREIRDHFLNRDERWVKKYDKWVGYYNGEIPALFLNDPNLIKSVLADKESFMNNVVQNHGLVPQIYQKEQLEITPTFFTGDQWFQFRRILVTFFNNKRLKLMQEILYDTAEETCGELSDLVRNGGTKREAKVDMFEFMKKCAIDLNTRTLLSLKSSQLNTSPDKVFKSSFGIQIRNYYFINVMNFLFGSLLTLLRTFGLCGHFSRKIKASYDRIASSVQEQKTLKGTNQPDLDIAFSMIEIRKELELSSTADFSHATDETINALFFAVLTDVTTNQRNTLSYMVYLLALNPTKQSLCRQEFAKHREGENTQRLSTEILQNNCPYAQGVFYETVRLYPGHIRRDRVCESDNCYLGGLHIPKGAIVSIPVMAMHRSEKYFDKPLEFLPERFLNKKWQDMKNDGIFLGFGLGIRRCIGEKMAELATLTVLDELLKNFEFFSVKETEKQVKFRNMPILYPINGFTVGVRKLN